MNTVSAHREAYTRLFPDSIISAKGQQSKKVQAVVIISPVSLPQGSFKKFLYTQRRVRPFRRQRSLSVCRRDCYRMQRAHALHRRSVDFINTVVSSVFRLAEKCLQLIGDLAFPLIRRKPCVVQSNVCNGPVSVTVVPVMASAELLPVLRMGRSVIDRVLSAKSRFGMAGLFQIFPAGVCRRFPERTVLLIRPQSEQLIEMGQMVGRIGPVTVGNKLDQMILSLPHRLAAFSVLTLMDTFS